MGTNVVPFLIGDANMVVQFCHYAGCRNTVPLGKFWCKDHAYMQKVYEKKHKYWRHEKFKGLTKEQQHKYNQKVYQQRMKSSPKENRLYKTSAWIKLSHRTLENSPVCVLCLKQGIIRKADVVDHIKPIRERWDLRLDPDNLQTLCNYHHRIKTQKDHKREKKMKSKENIL